MHYEKTKYGGYSKEYQEMYAIEKEKLCELLDGEKDKIYDLIRENKWGYSFSIKLFEPIKQEFRITKLYFRPVIETILSKIKNYEKRKTGTHIYYYINDTLFFDKKQHALENFTGTFRQITNLNKETKEIFGLIRAFGPSNWFNINLFADLKERYVGSEKEFNFEMGKILSNILSVQKKRGRKYRWYLVADPKFYTTDTNQMK